MRIFLSIAASCAVTIFAFGSVNAADNLLLARNTDSIPQTLAHVAVPPGEYERKPVNFSWALDPAAPLQNSEPYLAESKEYWQTVDGTELRAGVSLPLTSSGALIRVSPGSAAKALAPADMQLFNNGKAVHFDAGADTQALRAAGMDVSSGTRILRIDQAGAGRYTLQSAQAQGNYVVHVYEPQSDLVLRAQAARNTVLAGSQMRVAIAATRSGRSVPTKAEAILVAPNGESYPVTVEKNLTGQMFAKFQAPAQNTQEKGLWELQVFAISDGLPRDVRTAFAIATATAKLSGRFAIDPQRLQLVLPVQVGSEGRYEARGTLYATGGDGALHPVSQAHSAAWMTPGSGTLVLAFDPAHVPQGYGAPFEVRDLQLNDQTRMAPLERRERALRF